MSKLSTRMILLALAALVAACSSPTPTPTATPVSPGPNRYADVGSYSHGSAGPYCYAARFGVWSARSL